MCLGIPMKIRKIKGDFAEVEAGQLIRTVNIQMVSHIREGDYVIVHAGFAIEKVDPEKAKETLRLVDEPRPSSRYKTSNIKEERGIDLKGRAG